MKGIKGTLKEKIALLRLKQGDTEAFGYLYDVYAEKVYRYVYFRVSDSGAAHDILQEVFLQAWERIVAREAVKSFKSYVYRIAYYKVVDYYRAKERQAMLMDDMGDVPVAVSDDESKLDAFLLRKQISRLKAEYQDLIILRYIEGLGINEIADILAKDVNNVRVTLHRALHALRSFIAREKKK